MCLYSYQIVNILCLPTLHTYVIITYYIIKKYMKFVCLFFRRTIRKDAL